LTEFAAHQIAAHQTGTQHNDAQTAKAAELLSVFQLMNRILEIP
jgi:hypothetical protein